MAWSATSELSSQRFLAQAANQHCDLACSLSHDEPFLAACVLGPMLTRRPGGLANSGHAPCTMNKAFTREPEGDEADAEGEVPRPRRLCRLGPRTTSRQPATGACAASCSACSTTSARRWSIRCRGQPRTATAPRTATTSTARSGCARSTAGCASSPSGSRSPRSSSLRCTTAASRSSSALRCATSTSATRSAGCASLGVDEAESDQGDVSWISPIARALLKARVGDELKLATPGGVETIEVLEVGYPATPSPTA